MDAYGIDFHSCLLVQSSRRILSKRDSSQPVVDLIIFALSPQLGPRFRDFTFSAELYSCSWLRFVSWSLESVPLAKMLLKKGF